MSFRQLYSPIPNVKEFIPFLDWFSRVWNILGQVEEWLEIGGSGGEPAFENSWANVGGSNETAAFYKDPFQRVHLKGAIDTGTAGTTAFTLPENYRPSATIRIASNTGGSNYIEITSAGLVQPQAPTAYLDGVSFRAEQ